MKILVVGGGAREHALAWAIKRSPLCDALYCAPGNAGIGQIAELLPVSAEDVDGIVAFAQAKEIDFVVVGPEAPLTLGLVDTLEAVGIKAFGPSAAAARLEGSKGYMKDLAMRAGAPTARYRRVAEVEAARDFVRELGRFPVVIKADGLAAGKGVVIAENEADAFAAIDAALVGGAFGEAGAELVIEEFLEGEEVSFFALVDGDVALPFGSAQDHKRAFDGDVGPNTGGMGAYSPAPAFTPALEEEVMARIVRPTVRQMAIDGTPFRGVLFAGLMLTDQGPKLLEYNVRFGDPECQALMLRLKSDLLEALLAARDARLDAIELRWRDAAALGVVMAAKGYPGAYEKGTEIRGLDAATAAVAKQDGAIFHAATRRDEDGSWRAVGGRVLTVCALGDTVEEAQARAYAAIGHIDWPDGFCRFDIGWRAVKRERAAG